MKTVTIRELKSMMIDALTAIGMSEENIEIIVSIYLEKTMRGEGHHDINDFVWHIARVKKGEIEMNPTFIKLSSFGALESWDGGNGLGELTATFAMRRAIANAKEYGMGLCTIRNSNHYLSSSAYTTLAAQSDCIGIMIAKAGPSMGVPGYKGNIIGQSPNGYAFTTNAEWPVMMDTCLAYVSGHGKLQQLSSAGQKAPVHWGADSDGNPTTDPEKLLRGTRYPIGEHKGFGYAILCEVLTGILSGGPILDQTETTDGLSNVTTHTAIAIKADGLMTKEQFNNRSSELIERISDRAPGIRIPGKHSYDSKIAYEQRNQVEIDDGFINFINECISANKA